ncbi:MAG: hypothetical protein IPJ07_14430 [Acidobacteria bacterium]|nr:hypothetical protein [Acidobacteriota bacterium]
MDWFNDFTEADRQTCLESNTVTARRHGVAGFGYSRSDSGPPRCWLTLCYIVRRSEASNVDALEKALVDSSQSNEGRPGRFRSKKS